MAKTVRRRTKQKFWSRYHKDEVATAYLFILPLMIGVTYFYLIPMAQTLFYSLTKWGQFGGFKFIGFDNFKRLASDPDLLGAIRNTCVYTIFAVPGGILLSILIAALLNTKIRGRGLYRVIYFLPSVTMATAIAMVWRWMFNSNFGIINQALSVVGIKGPAWITDPRWAMFALIIVGIWSSLGTQIIIFLAGLQGIPQALYEAAELDGAGTARKFFSITLPMLTPTIFFSSITQIIGALQIYDLIYLMFSSDNPALRSVQSLSFLFYRQAFVFNDKGYGAAIVVVLLAITLLITVVQFSFQKRWVYYSSAATD